MGSHAGNRGYAWIETIQGFVRPSQSITRWDRACAVRIARAIEHVDLPNLESVSVYVRDGHATLYGLAEDQSDISLIVEIARRLAPNGVTAKISVS